MRPVLCPSGLWVGRAQGVLAPWVFHDHRLPPPQHVQPGQFESLSPSWDTDPDFVVKVTCGNTEMAVSATFHVAVTKHQEMASLGSQFQRVEPVVSGQGFLVEARRGALFTS